MEDSDSLFTGRVEIFLMDDEKTKIVECTIINGIKMDTLSNITTKK